MKLGEVHFRVKENRVDSLRYFIKYNVRRDTDICLVNEVPYLLLLVKLTGLKLVKNFLAFHGTRRFITTLTSFRHLSLSWASPIQSIYTHPTSWRSSLILSTHLRLGLPSDLLPLQLKSEILYMKDQADPDMWISVVVKFPVYSFIYTWVCAS